MREHIARVGPISFADYLNLALYDPHGGFFSSGGRAGRDGHFLTSPEVGPLFSAVLASALDAWWQELGYPDPFVVVEAGAGAGTLARDILAADAECAVALHYVLVERSEALRTAQGARLASERRGQGPLVTSLAALPAGPVVGVVLANELLDNLAFRLLERQPNGWAEVRLAWATDGIVEVLIPAAPALVAEAEGLAPEAIDGARIPLQHEARAWLQQACSLLKRGRVVVVDYADATPSLADRPWLDWVRTYRGHARGDHPVNNPGSQDITCEVAVDQLARVRMLTADRSQAEFLRAHGIDELIARAHDGWLAGAARGDLPALRHKSRLGEAEALLDPTGIGAFRVLEWAVG